VVCSSRFITAMVFYRHDWVRTISAFISLVFCVFWVPSLQLFRTPSVRLVRRLQLQYQFTRSWQDPAESSTLDLTAPKRTHLLDRGLSIEWPAAVQCAELEFHCGSLIYFSSVIDRTWCPRLVRLIALLVSIAWLFHLSVDWERVASPSLLMCCI